MLGMTFTPERFLLPSRKNLPTRIAAGADWCQSDRIHLVMRNSDMTRLIPPLEAVEIDFPWFQRTLEPPRFQLVNRSGETLRIRLGVTLTGFFGRTLRNEAPATAPNF